MKFKVLLAILSLSCMAQSQEYESLDSMGRMIGYRSFKRYDSVVTQPDKQTRHVIYYDRSGQKTEEFSERNGMKHDTMKIWSRGNLQYVLVYSETGYTLSYFEEETGKLFETGQAILSSAPADTTVFYDSATKTTCIPDPCPVGQPCYQMAGIWKRYYSNSLVWEEGEYLPMLYQKTTYDSIG